MSFNEKLFSMDLMPKQKRSRKSKARRNGSARAAARGFESPGFFMGLRANGNGIPKAVDSDRGLQIPPLGEEFNTRFGRIGTGFIETVDPFKVGFRDVVTGNGRAGEIIGVGAAIGKRRRGRPRKARRVKAVTKKERKEGKTIGAILGGAAVRGGRRLAEKLRERREPTTRFTAEELAREKEIDVIQRERFRAELEKDKDMDMDLTEDKVEEEDEEVMDEDMEEEELPALPEPDARREIDVISRKETEELR